MKRIHTQTYTVTELVYCSFCTTSRASVNLILPHTATHTHLRVHICLFPGGVWQQPEGCWGALKLGMMWLEHFLSLLFSITDVYTLRSLIMAVPQSLLFISRLIGQYACEPAEMLLNNMSVWVWVGLHVFVWMCAYVWSESMPPSQLSWNQPN